MLVDGSGYVLTKPLIVAAVTNIGSKVSSKMAGTAAAKLDAKAGGTVAAEFGTSLVDSMILKRECCRRSPHSNKVSFKLFKPMSSPRTTHFVSGHLTLTKAEFQTHYQPALDQALAHGDAFVVGDVERSRHEHS